MARPTWITPAGNLGTIPEGIFYQLVLLAENPVIVTTTCTATDSSTNLITCASTEGLWPSLEVMFVGQTFGGVNTFTRYFVKEVVDSTHFSISTFENGTGQVTLTTASGTMTANFNQHTFFTVQAGALPKGIQCSDNGLLEGVPKAVASIQGVPFEVAADVTSKFTIRAYIKNSLGVIEGFSERTFELTVTGQDAPEFITPAGLLAQYFDGSQVTDLQIEYTDIDPGDIVTIKLAAGQLPPGLTINSTGLISGFITPLSTSDATAGFSRDGQGFEEYPFDFSTRSVDFNYEFLLEVSDGKSNDVRAFSIQVYSRNNMTADNDTFTADNTFVTADTTPVRTPILLNTPGSIGASRSDNFYAYKFNGIDLDGDPFTYAKVSGTFPSGLTLDPTSGWLYGYIPDLGLTDLTYNFSLVVYKTDDPTVVSNESDFSLEIVGDIDSEVTWITPANLGSIETGSVSILNIEASNNIGVALSYRLKSGSDSSLPQGLVLLPSGDIAGRVSFDCFMLDNNATTFDVTLNELGITGIDTETTFDRTFTFTVEAYGGAGLISVFKTFTVKIKVVYPRPYENLYVEAMPPFNDRATLASLLDNTDIFPEELIYRPTDPYFGLSTNVTYWHAYGLTSSTYADYVSSLYLNHYWKNLTLGSIETAQALDDNGNIIYEVVYSRIIDNLVNDAGESVSKQVLLPYAINPGDSTEITHVYPNSLPNMRDQVIDTVGQVSNILPRWMLSKQTDGRVLGFTPAWVIAYAKPGKGAQIAYNIGDQFNQTLNVIDFKVDRYEIDRLMSRNWDPVTESWVPTPPNETTFDQTNTTVGWQNDDSNTVAWDNLENDPLPWINGGFPPGTYFDGGSLKFIEPVDMYSTSQEYDKYLVFPKQNILG